jgi:hypothetical protein
MPRGSSLSSGLIGAALVKAGVFLSSAMSSSVGTSPPLKSKQMQVKVNQITSPLLLRISTYCSSLANGTNVKIEVMVVIMY